MRSSIRIGLLGFVIGGLLLTIHVAGHRDTVIEADPFVSTFDDPQGGLEVLLVLGDGQAFAQLAMDPTLSHPESFTAGETELIYRAQRPLYIYATWLVALGNPDRVPLAMAILSAMGAGLLTGTLALLFERRGIRPVLAIPILFIPGIWASFPFLMPGALAAGLVLAGLAAWENDAHRSHALAGVLFAAAILTRETMVFIPAGLALAQLMRTRRLPSLWLAVGPLAYAAWWLIVRLVTGSAFVGQDRSGSRTSAPGVGLWEAVPNWSLFGRDTLFAAVTVALIIAALARCRWDPLLYSALIGLAAASLMNEGVWRDWENWTRAITPIHLALGLALLSSTTGYRVGVVDPNSVRPIQM